MNRISITYLLLASALLLSCKEKIDPVEDAITFSTNVVETKAIVSTADDIKGQGVAIYAIAELPNSTAANKWQATFRGTNLLWNGTASNWEYSPLQYWIRSAAGYYFVGFWPYSDNISDNFDTFNGSGNIVVKRTGDFSISKDAQTEDILIGHKLWIPASDGTTSRVPIDLVHAYAAVRFRVRNLTESAITVSNQYITGMLNHATAVSYTAAADAFENGSIIWEGASYTNGTSATTQQFKYDGSANLNVGAETYLNLIPNNGDFFLAIPQEHTTATLSFQTQKGSNTAISRSLLLADVTNGKRWEPGTRYDYLVTVASDKIDVQLTIVPWIDREYTLD